MLPEYKVYEHAIAVADIAIGWLYGVVAIGLFLNIEWGYKLAWIPGSILLYHGLSFWFWEANRRKAGRPYFGNAGRVTWAGVNLLTGALSLYLAWNG